MRGLRGVGQKHRQRPRAVPDGRLHYANTRPPTHPRTEHDVNTQLRGRLLDAWQCGFNRQPADVSMMSNTSGVGAF